MVERGAFALSTEAPVRYARPSIDVLFESAADSYAERVIGVVLTGSSEDGAAGAAHIKARGGVVIVQSPETAVSPVMPTAAFEAATLMRAREKSRHIPIIFLTAINKHDTHVFKGYSVGAVDYVFKPFDAEVLRAKVAAFVEMSRNVTRLREEIVQRKQTEARL